VPPTICSWLSRHDPRIVPVARPNAVISPTVDVKGMTKPGRLPER